ncbi:MAG: hypothetical protein AAF322_00815, partial [Pseudomonadota bacterium]
MTRPLGRSGVGARFDAPEAPARDLLLVRRATSDLARRLAAAPDDELAARDGIGSPTGLAIAELAVAARRLAIALAAVRGASTDHPHPHPEPRAAATLPPRALRHLFSHATIHLDVEWRDLPGPLWNAVLPNGAPIRS